MDQQEPRDLEIVVIDDSEVVREQLRRAFAEAEGLHLVGLAASGDEGIEMARSLRPDIIVLDEATSALDPTSQDTLMELLTKELDATTIVSVGHRPELEAFHTRKIVLERHRGGAKFITDLRLRQGRGQRLLERMLRRKAAA